MNTSDYVLPPNLTSVMVSTCSEIVIVDGSIEMGVKFHFLYCFENGTVETFDRVTLDPRLDPEVVARGRALVGFYLVSSFRGPGNVYELVFVREVSCA